ncbi:MAG: hypothetical protein HYS56_03910, partial [Candidatus Omnitrophica bacterium]|nr:hypothetical protein [Candidatus Omnitrophota bacterium]
MISKTLLVMFFLFLRHCEGLASFGDKNQWLAPPAAGSAYADFEKPFIPTQLPGPDDLVHYAEMLGQILTPGNESLFLRYANGKEIPLAILYATPPIFWEKIPQLLERNEWFRQFVEDKKTREIALKALAEAQKRINEGMKRAREIKGQVTIEIRPWITFFEYMDEWEVNEFLPKVSGYILDGKILEMEARSGVFIRELAGSFQVPAAGNKKKGKKKGGAAKRFFAVCHPS